MFAPPLCNNWCLGQIKPHNQWMGQTFHKKKQIEANSLRQKFLIPIFQFFLILSFFEESLRREVHLQVFTGVIFFQPSYCFEIPASDAVWCKFSSLHLFNICPLDKWKWWKGGGKKNFHEADVRLESLSENYHKLVEPLFELKPQGKFPAVFASYKLNYAGAFTWIRILSSRN